MLILEFQEEFLSISEDTTTRQYKNKNLYDINESLENCLQCTCEQMVHMSIILTTLETDNKENGIKIRIGNSKGSQIQ